VSGVTWGKFYWSDWESDPALRLCSYGAQGLWMRMLCIAAAHDPIGYVCVAGRALDETALARMTGGEVSEVQTLLAELSRNGVYSSDRTGRIYSRRMVRDARKFATARKNGKKGGNPSLGKDDGFPASVNPPVIPEVKTQKPEARNQKKKGDAKASLVPSTGTTIWDDAFSIAWEAYPKSGRDRSMSRAKCWPIWRDAAQQAGGADKLLAAVKRYVWEDKQHKEDCGAPAFERWLKGGRWEHWLAGGVATGRPVAVFADAEIRAAVIGLRGEAWTASWLDPCTWDPDAKLLIPRTNIAATKLRAELGPILRAHGVTIREMKAA
jgi:hypothetical protein